MKTKDDYRRMLAEHPVLSSFYEAHKNDERFDETLECMVTFQVEFEENGDILLNKPIKKLEDMNPKEKNFELIREAMTSF